jgi:quinol monooxygenase YgiN
LPSLLARRANKGKKEMTEVRVIARAVARKGNEDRVKALLQTMLAPTRAESGCKLYELYESNEWGRFYFYELWESQAALEQHAASPHYHHLELTIGDLLEEPFEVNILREVLS